MPFERLRCLFQSTRLIHTPGTLRSRGAPNLDPNTSVFWVEGHPVKLDAGVHGVTEVHEGDTQVHVAVYGQPPRLKNPHHTTMHVNATFDSQQSTLLLAPCRRATSHITRTLMYHTRST